jgi:hypothetical protein
LSVLAAIRPDSWNLPLFLHVLGATILFGTTGVLAIAAFAARGRPERAPLLSRVAFWTFLLGVIPSWLLMRVNAQWIDSKEFPHDEPGWVGYGYVVSEGGGLLLLACGILAWLWARKQGEGAKKELAVGVLASIVLVALGVAWFAMSAKP